MTKLPRLNLPPIKLRVRQITGTTQMEVWDILRKKFLRLTPEEWVRQHILAFLTKECGVATQLIRCEYPVNINGQAQRADIIVVNPNNQILLLVECKAPDVALDSEATSQIARYNRVFAAKHLLLTNGITHRLLSLDNGEYTPQDIATLKNPQ
ncbi:MAG: type I restriction enzyme HsdR N-terminal domain-containing protein [Rikenellaceae bacterium]